MSANQNEDTPYLQPNSEDLCHSTDSPLSEACD